VRSLMESSRPEAEERLRRSLALSALAEAENLKVDEEEIEAKLKEVKRQLSGERDIDPQRLRDAVVDDLLRDKLLGWLEENSSITEKAAATPTEAKDAGAKTAAPKKAAAKTSKTKAKAKADPDAAAADA